MKMIVKKNLLAPAEVVCVPAGTKTLDFLQSYMASGKVELMTVGPIDLWFDEEGTWQEGYEPNVCGLLGPVVMACCDADGGTIGLPEDLIEGLLYRDTVARALS